VQTSSGKTLVFSILVNDHAPDSNATLPVMDAIVGAIIAKD
jgi:D-alanyl-D-alanine carboxypeptidase